MKKRLIELTIVYVALALVVTQIQPAFAWGDLQKQLVFGPTSLPIKTYGQWTLTITLTVWQVPIYDMIIIDHLPAEVIYVSSIASFGMVSAQKMGKGNAGSTSITWNLGDLTMTGSYTLTLYIETRTSPNGKWVGFTTPGTYWLNYGANATYFIDSARTQIETLATEPIIVVAY